MCPNCDHWQIDGEVSLADSQPHMWYGTYMEVRLHPLFRCWLDQLVDQEAGDVDWFEVYVEVMALIAALGEFGRGLGDPESHPVVSAGYDLHALRRTPPTVTMPYADGPPVLRILYGFVTNDDGDEIAVVAIAGDKAALGTAWYQTNLNRAQDRIDQWCQHNPGYKPIIKRGGRR